MLIAAEALANETAEGGPIEAGKLAFDILKPTFGCTSKLHSGAFDPNRLIDEVHFKIILGLCDPQLRIVTVEFWKVELGKVTQRRMVVMEVIGQGRNTLVSGIGGMGEGIGKRLCSRGFVGWRIELGGSEIGWGKIGMKIWGRWRWWRMMQMCRN